MPKDAIWTGTASIKGSSESMRMILLTTCLIGLQLCWGLEMTYCMPYLLELGLTKAKTSLVWIAGPISGLVVAPIIGAVADKSKNKHGRRRPFMIGGSFAVAFGFWILGWTTEWVEFFLGKSKGNQNYIIFLAVFSIYAIDFAINVVQWSSRGLIVDTLPTSKQQLGSAWAARMTAFGHLVGYAIGALDLKQMFGTTLGNTQFKQLSIISALSLIGSVLITLWATSERVLLEDGDGDRQKPTGPMDILREVAETTMTMPPRVKAICYAIFWAWIGWFPFHFYGSTWVGEIYFRHEMPGHLKNSSDRTGDIGRIGSTALVVFSSVTFIGATGLPWIVRSPEDNSQGYTPRPPASLAPIVDAVRTRKPSLVNVWIVGHLIFACTMGLAPLVTSVKVATTLIGLCGISAAISSWAPFAFMGVEVNRIGRQTNSTDGDEKQRGRRNFHMDSVKDIEGQDDASSGALAGLYLGILNLFIAGPQFIASFISMLVFELIEPGKSKELSEGRSAAEAKEGVNAIAVCLFIGAASSVMAAYRTVLLKRTLRQRVV